MNPALPNPRNDRMKTVSLCMIIKDEEEVIGRCLSSVGPMVDEVIIVDTGSTDNSIRICESFGAKLFHFKWCDDFAAARNFSFGQATGDYILWLDADDVVEEAELLKLLALKENLAQDFYFLKYDYNQNAQGKSNCIFYRERIVRNRCGYKWRFPIHEVIDQPGNSTSEYVNITITHKRTAEGYEKDKGRNLAILQKAVGEMEYSSAPRIWYYLGRELHDHEQFQQAIETYDIFLAFPTENSWIEDRVAAAFRIAQCHISLYRQDNVVNQDYLGASRLAARKAIQMDARRAEPFFVMGEAAYLESQFEEAIFWFSKCLMPLPDVTSPLIPAYYNLLPHLNLVFCYNGLGDFEMANVHNEKALEFAPSDAGLLHNRKYFREIFKSGRQQEETRIAWYGKTVDSNFPTYRMRAINMDIALNQLGFASKMIDDQLEFSQFDSIVFFKSFSEVEFRAMQYALQLGKQVFFDVAEDLTGQLQNYPFYLPMVKTADAVICCSHELARKLRVFNENISVVEDAVEFTGSKEHHDNANRELRVGWIGMPENAHHAEKFRNFVTGSGYELFCIHNGPGAEAAWSQDSWVTDLLSCDIAIAPIDVELQPCKSNNKITAYMALGLPVIASPLDAYKRVIRHSINGYIADSEEEWRHYLELLKDTALRKKIGQAARHSAMRFRQKNIALKLARILAPKDYNAKACDLVIPTIYDTGHLRITVESIVACTQIPFNVIVIDNGGHARQLPDGIKVIRAEKLNYAASLNLGIAQSSSPYIGMLNDDLIVTDGWLEPLIASIQHGAGLSNPMSSCGVGITHHNHLEIGGVVLGPDRTELRDNKICQRGVEQEGVDYELFFSYDPQREKRVFRLDWSALYCTVTSRAVMEKVGQLDERFGHGHEDIDLSIRLNKLGFQGVMNEHSSIFHFGGTSTNQKRVREPDFAVKAEKRFVEKYNRLLMVIHAGLAYEAWNGASLEKEGIGGSETAAAKMAEAFSRIGYRVVVFCECKGLEGMVNHVEYCHLDDFDHFIARHVIDVFVVSRYAHLLEYPVKAVKTYFWAHDVHAKSTEIGENDLLRKHKDRLDGIFCLSDWHKDIFNAYHQVGTDKIILTGNGIDLSRFSHKPLRLKTKNRFIYTSSPDRGLLALLKLFPKIRELFPDASLHIYYGFENWDKSIQQSGDAAQLQLRNETYAYMSQDQVFYHGKVGQQELAQAFLESDIWLYPTEFAETYCISALEAQMSRTLCICSDLAALHTTVGDRGILVSQRPTDPGYGQIILGLLTTLQADMARKNELLQKGHAWALQQSWDRIAAAWQAHFQGISAEVDQARV